MWWIVGVVAFLLVILFVPKDANDAKCPVCHLRWGGDATFDHARCAVIEHKAHAEDRQRTIDATPTLRTLL